MSQYVDEKSDNVVVPTKRSNKEGWPSAETVEGRTLPEGNSQQTTVVRTQSRGNTSSGLMTVRQAAQQGRDVRFTALPHHITVDLLERSYNALKRRAAPGIDGVTWQAYIADKRLLRLISKWLKVGIHHDGRHERSSQGTPQGAVVSPILANVYLHYVFDLWANVWRRKKAIGDVVIVRYADDVVLGFEHEHEARAFLADLHERLKTFELTLHPDKTRLIQFGRWAINNRKRQGLGKPETFDFLGFTHFCTRSRKNGAFVIGRKTIRKRMRARLQFIKVELRRRLHESISETGIWLRRVLQGYLNYFSASGNDRSLYGFFTQVRWYWLRSLRRRSQKAFINWSQFVRRSIRFFPPIRLLHPHPSARFDAKTRRRSPVR